jgi:hypothetical protein
MSKRISPGAPIRCYVPFAPEVAGPPGPFGRRPDFPSGSAAADGDPPKKPILEVLRNAGISP